MPWVYYPFAPDHKHAGKFYRGWMPAGDVKGMIERSGARLAEPVTNLGLEADAPQAKLIVNEADAVTDDRDDAIAELDALKADLTTAGKSSLIAGIERTAAVAVKALDAAVAAGNLVEARAALQRIEEQRDNAAAALGNVIPMATPAPQYRAPRSPET